MRATLSITVACALGVGLVGCADLGQVGTIEARKSFRIAIEAVEVDAPEPTLAALVGEDEVAALLLEAGAPPAAVAQLGESALGLDLDAIDQVVPLAPILDDLEALLVSRMQEHVDAAARDALGDGALQFESDWSAWEAWDLDLVDPDGSIERALETLPVTYRLLIEAESLSELLGGEGSEEGEAAQDVDDAAELDLVRTLFLREIGLRTLTPDEVEPAEGWSDAEEAAVEAALRDPAAIDTCGDNVPLDPHLAARLSVQSMADPFVFATLAELDLGGVEACGVRLASDEDANLKDYLEDGMRLIVTLETTVGVDDFVLGGYVAAGLVGRVRLPGTIVDLAGEL